MCDINDAPFEDRSEKISTGKSKDYLDRLKESESLFRIIAENAHDLITILNEKGEIIYASPSYRDVLGYAPSDYLGKSFLHNVHPNNMKELEETYAEALKGGHPWKLQFRQMHKTERWIWSELRGAPVFDSEGRFILMVIVTRDISIQKEYELKLNHFAYHDSLTGLPNRRLLYKRLTASLKELTEKQDGLAVIMVDIDDFKLINDTMGHDIGDEVISEFGKRLKKNIRKIDTVARLGGDEFAVLLPRIESEKNAAAIAKRVQKCIRERWYIDKYNFNITFSMGIAMAPVRGATVSSMLKKADKAMYEAKAAGKNNFMFYQEE